MGINASQAREVFAAARAHGLFAGEAMWSKFLPKFDVIRQILDTGMLGDLRTVVVDNGEYFTPSTASTTPPFSAARCWTWASTHLLRPLDPR